MADFTDFKDGDAEGINVTLTDPNDSSRKVGITADGKLQAEVANTVSQPLHMRLAPQSLDAFGRLRVSEPTTLFESSFYLDKQPLLWDEQITGAATISHDSNKCSVQFTTSTASGDSAIFQTRRYLAYHPGKSKLVIMTGNLGGLKANCRRRFGNFDDSNGVFFELNGTQTNVVIRSKVSGSVVDTVIPQSSWNVDKLDGTGSSGITIDWSKQELLLIDLQWLGSGSVRFGTIIGGNVIYVHQQDHANTLPVPWSQTAILPLRVEMTNTGTTASTTTGHLTCATVIIEGTYGPEGILRTASNLSTPKTFSSVGTTLPILSLRKSSTGARCTLTVQDISIFCNSADDFLITVIKNGTLTGASWTSNSGIGEKDVTASAISGGYSMYSVYVRGSAASAVVSITDIFREAFVAGLGSDFVGNSELISIVGQNITASASVYAIINYKEFV